MGRRQRARDLPRRMFAATTGDQAEPGGSWKDGGTRANCARAEAGAGSWFTESRIAEAVIAHELYHLITQQPSAPVVETAAHAFAEELLGLPFSPKLYETLLTTAC